MSVLWLCVLRVWAWLQDGKGLTYAFQLHSAVEGTSLLLHKDTVIWRGLGSSDRGPARVQW